MSEKSKRLAISRHRAMGFSFFYETYLNSFKDKEWEVLEVSCEHKASGIKNHKKVLKAKEVK
jgi:hypothetical protein